MSDSSGTTLAAFQREMEFFAESQLRDYTASVTRASVPRLPKEFSDPVWATIYLTPFEIVIIDSPLFQRLRRIKQLGVVHWVYPGATHTRFEHSLGTLYQMQELIDSINREGRKQPEIRISDDDVCVLRLSALCHDLGHGLMSHVSDNALRSIPAISDLTLAFADEQKVERVRLSEMAAYYIAGSPAFRTLVEKAKQATDERNLPPDAVDKMQRAIVGDIINNKVPLMQELVSGPFDADKLDYMQRDAMMAGVPTVTDVPRLTRKVRAISLREESLPPEIKHRVTAGENFYILFGIAYSGSRTLDELLFGRILLFDKLYRHQKARAAEGMVSILIFTLQKLFKGPPFLLPYVLDDDQLLDVGLVVAYHEHFDLTGTEKAKTFEIACEISGLLRRRHLYVRAFAFAKNMPGDPYGEFPEQVVGADKLLRAAHPSKKHSLSEAIAKEAIVIIDTLGHNDLLQRFVDQSLLSYIYIDPPEPPGNAGKIPQAYLLAESGRITRFRDAATEMRSWADAYLFAKDIGYVFCPRELKPYVYLASKIVVRRDFNIRPPESVFDYIKEDAERTREIDAMLVKKGFYCSLPHDIRPKAERLQKADIPGLFDNLRGRLQGYCGPYIAPDGRNLALPFLTDRHVQDWLQQFEEDSLISAAIQVLGHLALIGRKEVVEPLKKFLQEKKTFKDAVACPLGDTRDSGSTAVYFAGDIPGLEVRDLRDVLSDTKDCRPILLVDDFIGSGCQAVTFIETLLQRPLSFNLQEAPRYHLSKDQQERLRDRQLCFAFAAGWTEGAKQLEDACRRYNLSAEVTIGVRDGSLPSVFEDGLYSSSEQKAQFLEKCRAIGRDLLFDPTIGHDEKWLEDKTLGYGNKGLLITFPYNTPTQALTCLWKGGKHKGVQWIPLFARRKKT